MKSGLVTCLVIALAFVARPAIAETIVQFDVPGAIHTLPMGIDNGKIVGYYSNDESSYPSHGFLYDGQGFTTLDFPGATSTQPLGIGGGRIVGYYDTGAQSHGFIYESGVFSTFDHPLASKTFPFHEATTPFGVSGNRIVGLYGDTSGRNLAFIYDGTAFTDLVTPYSPITYIAYGIEGNNVVGAYLNNSISDGYMYDGHNFSMIHNPLGVRGTFPRDLSGNIVVGGYADSAQVNHAFMFDGMNYTTLDIPTTIGTNSVASGISGGTIVGFATDLLGHEHGFVTIPEPTSIDFLLWAWLTCLYRKPRILSRRDEWALSITKRFSDRRE